MLGGFGPKRPPSQPQRKQACRTSQSQRRCLFSSGSVVSVFGRHEFLSKRPKKTNFWWPQLAQKIGCWAALVQNGRRPGPNANRPAGHRSLNGAVCSLLVRWLAFSVATNSSPKGPKRPIFGGRNWPTQHAVGRLWSKTAAVPAPTQTGLPDIAVSTALSVLFWFGG